MTLFSHPESLTADGPLDFEERIDSFETARFRDAQTDLRSFLPASDHPDYAKLLCELIRVDMEYASEEGQPLCLDRYREAFPCLDENPELIELIGFEKGRLSKSGPVGKIEPGQPITPSQPPAPDDEVDLLEGEQTRVVPRSSLASAALSYRDFLDHSDCIDQGSVDSWADSYSDDPAAADLIRQLHRSKPSEADRFVEGVLSLPEVGTEFLGFRLVKELGQGAFGKVFLAQQGELADRPVALKVATDLSGESNVLAQLQHTHIVPIYSVHLASPFQAVCMPYLGGITLADVYHDVSAKNTLPESGKGLVSTLIDRRSRDSVSDSSIAPGDQIMLDGEEEGENREVRSFRSPLTHLSRMTYVQSILWLGSRLADGLGHAHERGILHRDLKPANILLSDEGQPLLLDFNLSADTKGNAAAALASMGGTLPYMAPEHLEAFRQQEATVDARSDIFSFGVILFELLTGQAPFPTYRGMPAHQGVQKMIDDRKRTPPTLRDSNPAITPAVEAIVRHCLEPAPEDRYQTARELQEDLQRHLDDLPLVHQREPSIRERCQKWMRRHPRLTSSSSIIALSLLVVFSVVSLLMVYVHRSKQKELAGARFEQALGRMESARYLLQAHSGSKEKLDEGVRTIRAILDEYPIHRQSNWDQADSVQFLPDEKRLELRSVLGEALWLLARAETSDSEGEPAQTREALRMNLTAETCYTQSHIPPTLLWQRARFLRALGEMEGAKRTVEQAEKTNPRSANDFYFLASERCVDGRFSDALPLLDKAVALDSRHFWAWFLKGVSLHHLARDADSLACYTVCTALKPDYPWTYYNVGLIHLRRGDYMPAERAFDRAIELDPKPEMYLHRAMTRYGQRKPALALEDAKKALDLGGPSARSYMLRSRVLDVLGRAEEAKSDREKARSTPAKNEYDWIALGLAYLPGEPEKALASFENALALAPRSLVAMQNKAHALAELPSRLDEGIATLARLIELYPDYVPARSGIGVLYARKGERHKAIAAAERALSMEESPAILYQVAGIYSLTSRTHRKDRETALRLLGSALRKGFGYDLLDKDRDLDPIREDPRFQKFVEVARSGSE